MDLLYQGPGEAGVQVILGSRRNSQKWEKQDFFSNYVLKSSENADCKDPNISDMISIPNSNAFIDLNGDCVPDVVLTRQSASGETYYEVY